MVLNNQCQMDSSPLSICWRATGLVILVWELEVNFTYVFHRGVQNYSISGTGVSNYTLAFADAHVFSFFWCFIKITIVHAGHFSVF